jgi:ATP-dependent DNA helicase RecG
MESQNIEYKRDWNDEYIKWICGFANSQGGKICIGISDDGKVYGLSNEKKLMEDIPNKVKDILGIMIDVNLKTKSKKNYIEIIVEQYPYPVNYRGQYFFRSGCTKQELKGAALDRFILKKQGNRWDGVPQPKLMIKDLSKSAFDYFKKQAAHTNRITPKELKDNPQVLLEKLLLKTDTGYYKRATVLLFHPNPEKYIAGAFVKIGYFNTDDDLAFQDEIHGNLFEQVEKTMDLLLTKYLKATISYKGLYRIEQYPMPKPALREAVLNAIIHKDYSSAIPIQISVYADMLMIWNEGQLPDNWTVARLKIKHPSRPFNPDIANCFFRAGLIETWGRGTINILNECKLAKVAAPSFKYDLSGFIIEFKYKAMQQPVLETTVNTSEKILQLLKQDKSITMVELSKLIAVSLSTIERTIKRLQKENAINRIGSDKSGYWIIIKKRRCK